MCHILVTNMRANTKRIRHKAARAIYPSGCVMTASLPCEVQAGSAGAEAPVLGDAVLIYVGAYF